MSSEDTPSPSAANPAENNGAPPARGVDPETLTSESFELERWLRENPEALHPIERWIREHADRGVITLRQAEREHILRAMILCRGNVELAAERLGITRKTLYRRLAEYRRAG